MTCTKQTILERITDDMNLDKGKAMMLRERRVVTFKTAGVLVNRMNK